MPRWRETTIDGIACDWFDVEGTVRSAVVMLPGDGWPTADDRESLNDLLAARGMAAVAPRISSSWWLDRPEAGFPAPGTPGRFVSESVTAALSRELNQEISQWGVLGVGSGGQGALQVAYRWPRRFPAAAAVAPQIDFHRLHAEDELLQALFETPEAARQQTATLNLHPLNWPPHQFLACDPADYWRLDGCERLASKLSSIGIPCEVDIATTTGGDLARYIAKQIPRAIEFLADRLRG